MPRGLRVVYGGIVKHPETNLWQIWLMADERCTFVAAYRDRAKAQRTLETLINTGRRGGSVVESAVLYKLVRAQADGELKQLPFDMMLYLIEHLDRSTIELLGRLNRKKRRSENEPLQPPFKLIKKLGKGRQ